ncbi:ATP-binding protein [Kitasatospora sp. NPDC101183]|uniref:ATP-binding protein n=1 Tax=Kitasatospora sp. NPDC101183 TaxID=3364100 RepID=UPI00381B59DB
MQDFTDPPFPEEDPGPQRPEQSVRLSRHRLSARAARSLLRTFLAGVPGAEVLAADGQIIVTELVTNAVVHARVPGGTYIEVRFELVRDHLRIEVHDASGEKPVLRRSTGPDDLSGRGLRLVEALSARWGCTPRPGGTGKLVWALVGPEGGAR